MLYWMQDALMMALVREYLDYCGLEVQMGFDDRPTL